MRPIAVSLNSFRHSRSITVALLAALVLVSTAVAAERNPARRKPDAAAEQETAQRIIVRFRQSSSLSIQASKGGESAAASSAAADATRMTALASRTHVTVHRSKALGGSMHLMEISPLAANEAPADTLARLRADSDVEFAEPDRRVYLHATDTNDPHYTLNTSSDWGQWYLRDVEKSAVNARAAWDITTGSNGIVIADLDTGVLYNHEDLLPASSGGKLLPGYDFVSPDSANNFTTAGDGNGQDGDASDPGDYCTSQNESSSWHGTRVSGIIGALTNNNIGVSGINWKGYLLPVRVIGRCGGSNSDVIAGMYWAAGLAGSGAPTNPYPAQIINISLGGSGACDRASQQAINDVTAAGVLVVVSAGNEEGAPVDSPANCTGAMAILGLRNAGTKVGFSNLGPQIALGAPGGNCVNDIQTNPTLPCVFSIDTTSNTGTTSPGANTYTTKNSADTNVGTSFSAPIVSGIAGLMLSVNGNLKSKQLILRLKEGASPYPTTSTTTTTQCQMPSTTAQDECICNTAVCGAGMANAYGAVLAALRPIAAVTFPASYAAGSSVTLNAAGSAGACGRSITNYEWRIVTTAQLIASGPTATSAMLTAPGSGAATVVQLTITDDAGKTDAVSISVGPTSTQADAPAAAGNKACLTDITPPPAVSIAATDASAAEANADPGMFTISRTGSTAAAITVNLSYSGTANSGTDYTALASTVTIPAGSASTTLTVAPIDNSVVDGARTVIATVQPGSGYQVGGAPTATVTIADNDTAAAPPPANSTGGGKGGGGALDPAALLGVFALALFTASRRVRTTGAQRARS